MLQRRTNVYEQLVDRVGSGMDGGQIQGRLAGMTRGLAHRSEQQWATRYRFKPAARQYQLHQL